MQENSGENIKGISNASDFLPWYNFPLVDFIQNYIKPNMNIFEFGTGFSSLFYAKMGCNVFGVEANPIWFEKVGTLAGEHNLTNKISIEFCERPHEFASYITHIPSNVEFDVIIVDSYNRIACLKEARKRYSKGLIILDNSERPNLQNARYIMQGFECLHFKGRGHDRVGESESLVFFHK